MSLITQLKQISDPRHLRGRRHELWVILFLSLLGFLCGYPGYRPLASFCRNHEPSLRLLLALSDDQPLPSYSTFRRHFLQTSPDGLIAGFNHWAMATLPTFSPALLPIDGKSIRATSTGGNGENQNFVSLVSLYSEQLGVLHIRMMENKKASEIHVAQALLAQLPALPPGQCFSFDALHTQTATAIAVNETGQDYLMALKKNQLASYTEVETLSQTQVPISQVKEQDDSHGRQVHRTVELFEPTPALRLKFPKLASVARVQRTGLRLQKQFSETVYYLSSRPWRAADLLKATKEHWTIENKLHWVKDVLFKEDDPARRGGHAPVNWAIFNSFAITLARRGGYRTVPDALRAWANMLDNIYLFFV
jgi:predicted transposase YbfD/YdcC